MSIWNVYLPEISRAFQDENIEGIWSRIRSIPANPNHISSSIATEVQQGFAVDMVKASFACFSLYTTGVGIVLAEKNGNWDSVNMACKQAYAWDSCEQNRKLLSLVQSAADKKTPNMRAKQELLTKVAPILKAHLEKTIQEIYASRSSDMNVHMKIAGKRPDFSQVDFSIAPLAKKGWFENLFG